MDFGSKANSAASIGRLDLYIHSGGSQLPKDWESFTLGEKRYGACLFCLQGNDVAHIPVLKYEVEYKDSGADTGALCCSKCYRPIKLMLEEFTMERSSAERRIIDLLDNENYPRGWVHFDTLAPKNVQTRTWQCFFCYIQLGSVATKRNLISLPVIHSPYITGGKVAVCSECLKDYVHLREVYSRSYTTDNCPNCGGNYMISNTERARREESWTSGKCLCPTCVSDLLINDMTMMSTELEDIGYRRIHSETCPICKGQAGEDITVDEAYRSEISHKGMVVCPDCLLERHFVNMYNCAKVPFKAKDVHGKLTRFYSTSRDKIVIREDTDYKKDDKGQSVWVIDKADFLDYLLTNIKNGSTK